jgi:hypothetical protein
MALAVFSHFLLDLPMHPADMALWPGSSIRLGMGLWRTLPTGWWFVEPGSTLKRLRAEIIAIERAFPELRLPQR